MTVKNTLGDKAGKAVNAVVLKLVQFNCNSACTWIYHQPPFPEEAKYLKKVH